MSRESCRVGRWRLALVLAGLGCWAAVPAQPSPARLPQPLTLADALSLADAAHPDLARKQAALDLSRAEQDAATSAGDASLSLVARARWVDPPSVAADQSPGDHQIGLVLSKRLYDFGQTEAREAAAGAEVLRREALLTDARQQRRITIMQRFFDVILADLRYARDNEAMAVAYVNLDRLRDRHKLHQISDIDLLGAEADYQKLLRSRTASASAQRSTRAKLALAMNRPEQLPGDLAAPDLAGAWRELPDVSQLQARALASNPRLRALREQLLAATRRLEAARAAANPVIRGELETSAYSRTLGSYDHWRAGVILEVPLYTGGRVKAEIAQRQAEIADARAQLAQGEMDVRQAVLDLWLDLDTLRVQKGEAKAEADFRDLYLDRSRALYEMEVKADLGDSMVRTTGAQLYEAQTTYAAALAQARLDALMGVEPEAMVTNLLKGAAR